MTDKKSRHDSLTRTRRDNFSQILHLRHVLVSITNQALSLVIVVVIVVHVDGVRISLNC
jgi:hypothetical protein